MQMFSSSFTVGLIQFKQGERLIPAAVKTFLPNAPSV